MSVGLAIVFVMAAAQTASSELTGLGLASLKAPFFTVWLHTAYMAFVLPITTALEALGLVDTDGQCWRARMQADLWDNAAAGRGVPPMVRRAICFYVLWVGANYSFASGLVFASAGLVTAVFSSCSALVAVLSWLWLKERMTVGKVMSVLLAIGGILILALSKHSPAQGSNPALGVILALIASMCAAVYKVAFKVVMPGEPSMHKLALFLTLIGGVNLVIGTLPGIALAIFGVEEAAWHPSSPISGTAWAAIFGGTMFVLIFNTSIAIGIAVTTPLFISIGTGLTTPATMIVDVFLKGSVPPWEQCLGASVLLLSFAVLILASIMEHRPPDARLLGDAGGVSNGEVNAGLPRCASPQDLASVAVGALITPAAPSASTS